jgi:cytochrome c553
MVTPQEIPQKHSQKTQQEINKTRSSIYLAAFTIVFFVYMQMQRAIYRSGIEVEHKFFHVFDSILNSFIIPLLFFIAGKTFIILSSDKNRKEIFYKAIDLIIYPYLLWSLLQGFIQTQFNFLTDGNLTMLHVISNLLTIPLAHFEYLYATFFMVVIAIFLLKERKTTLRLLLLIFSAALCFFNSEVDNIFPLYLISQHLFFFVLGAIVCEHNTLQPNKKNIAISSLALLIFLQWLFHSYYGLESYSTTIFSFLLSTASLFLLSNIANFIANKDIVWLETLGRSAFIIFLAHLLLGSGVRVILQDALHINSFAIHLILDCFSALAGGLLLYIICKRFQTSLLWQPPQAFTLSSLSGTASSIFQKNPFVKYLSFAICLGIITTLLTIFIGSEIKIRKQYDYSDIAKQKSNIVLSTAPEVIEQGKRLAQIYGCYAGCHGKSMEGGLVIDTPFRGKTIAPNLTQSFKKYSVDELEIIVRKGLRPDGTAVVGGMPITGYHFIPDNQLSAIFSFIASYPLQKAPSKKPSVGLLSRIDLLTGKQQTHYEEIRDHFIMKQQLSNGERMARAACSECHGANLMGRENAPPLIVAKAYSQEDFKKFQKTGLALGDRQLGLMSIMAKHRFSNFTDSELDQIYRFISEEL